MKSLFKSDIFRLGVHVKLLVPFLVLITGIQVITFAFVHYKFNAQVNKNIQDDLEFNSESLLQVINSKADLLRTDIANLKSDPSLIYYLRKDYREKTKFTSQYLANKKASLFSGLIAVVDKNNMYLAESGANNYQMFSSPSLIRKAERGDFATDIIKIGSKYFFVAANRLEQRITRETGYQYIVSGYELDGEFLNSVKKYIRGDVAIVIWEKGKTPWLHEISSEDIQTPLVVSLSKMESIGTHLEQEYSDFKFSITGHPFLHDEQGNTLGNFYLVNLVPHTMYNKERNSLNLILILTFVSSLLVSIFVGYKLSKKLSSPIRLLTEGARRIAEGHLDTQIQIEDKGEFGELGTTFNRMTQKLRVELEEKLKRTAELRNQTDALRKVNQDLDRKLFESSLLLEISNSTNASMNKDKIVNSILEIIISSFGYRQIELFMLNDTGDRIEYRKSREVSENDMGMKVFSDRNCRDLFEVPNLLNMIKISIFQNQSYAPTKASPLPGTQDVKGFLIIPVRAGNKVIGALQCLKQNVLEVFSEDEVDSLMGIASHMTLTLENLTLHSLSNTDSLTQINNVRYFKAQLQKAVNSSLLTQSPTSVIIGDVDHFKKFNDTYGHALGDEVLKRVAQTLKNESRDQDIPARYGGEEFVVLLPDTPEQSAFEQAERIRQAIENLNIESDSGTLKVTMSLGIATCPLHTDKVDELIKLADRALYLSKNRGRNQSSLYDPQTMGSPKSQEQESDDTIKIPSLNSEDKPVLDVDLPEESLDVNERSELATRIIQLQVDESEDVDEDTLSIQTSRTGNLEKMTDLFNQTNSVQKSTLSEETVNTTTQMQKDDVQLAEIPVPSEVEDPTLAEQNPPSHSSQINSEDHSASDFDPTEEEAEEQTITRELKPLKDRRRIDLVDEGTLSRENNFHHDEITKEIEIGEKQRRPRLTAEERKKEIKNHLLSPIDEDDHDGDLEPLKEAKAKSETKEVRGVNSNHSSSQVTLKSDEEPLASEKPKRPLAAEEPKELFASEKPKRPLAAEEQIGPQPEKEDEKGFLELPDEPTSDGDEVVSKPPLEKNPYHQELDGFKGFDEDLSMNDDDEAEEENDLPPTPDQMNLEQTQADAFGHQDEDPEDDDFVPPPLPNSSEDDDEDFSFDLASDDDDDPERAA